MTAVRSPAIPRRWTAREISRLTHTTRAKRSEDPPGEPRAGRFPNPATYAGRSPECSVRTVGVPRSRAARLATRIISQLFRLCPLVCRCRIEVRSARREQLPQERPASRGAVVLGAGARVPVEVEDLDRQPMVAKELGELLDVNGLARERRRIEAGQNCAVDLHGRCMASPRGGSALSGAERPAIERCRYARASDPCRTRRGPGRGPGRPSRSRGPGVSSSLRMACARAGASSGGTRRPVRWSSTRPGVPPTRVPTTGRPVAMASRTTFEQASLSEARTKMSTLLQGLRRFSRGPSQLDAARQTQRPDPRLEVASEWAVAPDDEPGSGSPSRDDGRGLEELHEPLLGAQVGQGCNGRDLAAVRRRRRGPEPREIDAVGNHAEPIVSRGARVGKARGDRLGVHEDVRGQPEGHGVNGLLAPAPEVAHVALAGDHRRGPSESRRGHADDIAVEVEAVDEPHGVAPEIGCQAKDRHREPGRLERGRTQAPGLQADGLQAGAQRALGADAGDVKVPAGAIEPAGHLRELALGAAQVQGVTQEEHGRSRPGHDVGPRSRRTARLRTTSAQSRSQ